MPRSLQIPTAKKFIPLLEPHRYKGLHGGRGSGKSHFFADLTVEDALRFPGDHGEGLREVCVREVQRDLKESAKLLIEDKLRKFSLGESDGFKVFRDVIETPGDGLIIFRGMQDYTAESVKSLENFHRAWNEEGQTLSDRSLEMLRPTIRAEGSELWFSWNPRNAADPVDKLLRGETLPPDAVVIEVNYCDNPFFPKVLDEERRHDEANNRDRYAHIWLGAYEPMAIGAIWDRQTIREHRRSEAPTLSRIVVAVDPAVSSEDGADENGIVACGMGEDGRGYVLQDASMKGGPREWADRAITLFDMLEADAIVIETNQGGEMCRNTLHAVRPSVPVIEVRATRGKHVRAEPIAALYKLGRISHVGTFPQLEDQLCLMTAAGYEGKGSPDRCDALVWGLTELFPKLTTKTAPQVRRVVREPREHGWMG